MPIHFDARTSRHLADISPGGWPIVLCAGLSQEMFRRVKARLGRFEIHVRRNVHDHEGLGLAAKTWADAIIIPFGLPGPPQALALRLRREAAGRQVPVLLLADRAAGSDLDPVSPYDGSESVRKAIELADLPDELSHYIQVRERFHGAGLETLYPASLGEVYRAACQSDFYG